jgi:hypothetical protein
MSEFVSCRRFGGWELAVIHAGVMHWQPAFDDGQDWREGAETDAAGRAILGINGMVARAPSAVVAIDPNSLKPEIASHAA